MEFVPGERRGFKMQRFRIGSRESRLAVAQSEMLQRYLQAKGIEAPIVTLKTTGDMILDRTLDQIGGKGLFVRELDMALREKRTDLSVHSLKDMPMDIPEELPLIGYSGREDPRDVLVLPAGVDRLQEDKPIGCSSRRRILQAKKLFPRMQFQNIRGNVITRLKKLDSGEYSALILAAAGLKRLELEERISRYFSVEEIIPCAGQGVLALQGRRGEDYSVLEGFVDKDAAVTAACERTFVRAAHGECSSPIAAYARLQGDGLRLRGMYSAAEDGEDYVTGEAVGDRENPEQLGRRLAEQLLQKYAERELR